MKSLLRKCVTCNEYTLKQVCAKCFSRTLAPIPARFSPEDKYGKYRRALRDKNA